jgi:hypothetical protein
MATEYRPLFNKHLLSARVTGFQMDLSPEAMATLQAWVRDAASRKLRGKTEVSLQGQFFADVFGKVLGYGESVGRTHYHLRAQKGSDLRGAGRPDGTLGLYEGDAEGQTRVVIELKAPGANLDARQPGYGNITPVEQAFRYVTQFDDCRWVIVSNFETLRLYSKTRGQGYWHEFHLAELSTPDALRQFLYLLSRNSLMTEWDGRSQIDALAAETHVQEQEITKRFYAFYKDVRGRTFRRLVADNAPPVGKSQADHEVFLLEKTQRLLDRVLFICVCEDTGLLPPNVITKAFESAGTGFVPTTRWQQMCGLFNSIDKGNKTFEIPGYNGGLFVQDRELEAFVVDDSVLDDVLRLSSYDFATDLNVNILGHVFEQSISDLEALRAEILGENRTAKDSKRKKEGVFYTPEFITQFIVENTVGSWLAERFEEIRLRHDLDAIDGRKKEDRRRVELAMWLEYQDVLRHIKVLDPACGSGAFLVAAFDFLMREYRRVNEQVGSLEKAKGPGIFDLDRQILQQNLYGVDINPESVEITKLSLWLKTARRDKPLNNLDGNIKCGNSIIAPLGLDASAEQRVAFDTLPPEIRLRAFDWRAQFPGVFENGRDGFNCVIGNPPYVRQELLTLVKPYFQTHYSVWHGMADLFVYFYERGISLLSPGGKLSYIANNKWLRSGYGEALRGFLASSGVIENIVDFGHAPIFEDADTFPCVVGFKKCVFDPGMAADANLPTSTVVCPMPRDALGQIGVRTYVDRFSYTVPRSRFGSDAWSLEEQGTQILMEKVRSAGKPLVEVAGLKPYRGVVTGCNEAFIVDSATRNRLVSEHPSSEMLVKPFFRGRSVGRWCADVEPDWLIFARRGVDISEFPAIERHLLGFREILEPQPPGYDPRLFGPWKGRKAGTYLWYEVQDSVDYFREFERPKIVYQEIQFLPRFAFDTSGALGLNKVFFIPTDDLYLLAVLNSPLMWWHNWRYLPHMKDEALNPAGFLMETLPIAQPSDEVRGTAVPLVQRLIAVTEGSRRVTTYFLDWLRIEFGIDKPGQKLEEFATLDSDGFVQEVRKRMPKGTRLTPALLATLRATFDEHVTPMRQGRAEALALERLLSDLVNQAYGLTSEEIDLMWKTAPPRMPVGR